jgi:ankyrin repeat protein
LFIDEFKMNINQLNDERATPLYFAHQHLEMARFLLENGANANEGAVFGPISDAVRLNNMAMVHLLLQYRADPNKNRLPIDKVPAPRNTDMAIQYGYAEILRMLLQHGAIVAYRQNPHFGTPLNILLRRQQQSRETKLDICRILVEHAKNDPATATFMNATFEFAIRRTDIDGCQILLEAEIEASAFLLYRSFHFAIRAGNLAICQLLVRDVQVDPFLQGEDDDETVVSPFQAAARQSDTSILEDLMLLWDERFASTGGKNSDGDYPIHVVCCDPLVSLEAIMVLVNRHADALAMVDGEQGLLPFHIAANWSASLDVIFYLLQHCLDALRHGGNAGSAPLHPPSFSATGTGGRSPTGTAETRSNDNKQHPLKKKAKTARSG